MKKSSVVHFEMPAKDRKRMSSFYNSAFGWETNQLGEEMGNYVLVTTAETDSDGMLKKPGAINGGFYEPKDDGNEYHPSLVIGVEDIDDAMDKIIDAGGKILNDKMDIPGYGVYVSFLDTEGNRLSVMQPSRPMQN